MERGHGVPRVRSVHPHAGVLAAFLILWAAGTGFCLEIEATNGYSRDFLPVSFWDTDVNLTQEVLPALSLKTKLQYLDFSQPSMQGIRPMRAQVGSGLAGLKLTIAQGRILATALGGVDVIDTREVAPRYLFEGRFAPPIPINRFVNHIAFAPTAWYTRRIVNAMAVRNEIATTGFSGELSAMLGTRTNIACSFRREYLTPRDTVLDTSYFEPRPGGIYGTYDPMMILRANGVAIYAGYIYTKIHESFYAGYAFSWSDSRHDRWMLTGEYIDTESTWNPPIPGVPQNSGRVRQYAYYPYTTFRNEQAHLAVFAVPIRFGARVRWDSKIVVPLYARKQQTLRNAAAINEETRVSFALTDRSNLSVAYEYFCFPYTSWGYFTADRYYIHTLRIGLRHSFPGNTEGGTP